MKFASPYTVDINQYVNKGYRGDCSCGWKSPFYREFSYSSALRDEIIRHAQEVHGVRLQSHG